MRKLITGAAIGWAAIVWLACWQIQHRAEVFCYSAPDCLARYAAQRDSALIWGLSIGLVGAIVLGLALVGRSERLKRGGANQVQRPQVIR